MSVVPLTDRIVYASPLVRQDEEQFDAVDQVPERLRNCTPAVRAFDADAMMVGFELPDRQEVERAIERQLSNPAVAYSHFHFAAPGCYGVRVDRLR